MELPTVTECNDIPNDRSEIPTPNVISHQPHMCNLPIPELNPDAQILLLIGRNLSETHHVRDQRIRTRNVPFAQRLNLGWVVVGYVCLGNFHKPTTVASFKTTLIDSHRETIFKLCSNVFQLKNGISKSQLQFNVFYVQGDDNETRLGRRSGVYGFDGQIFSERSRWTLESTSSIHKSSPVITKQSSSSI